MHRQIHRRGLNAGDDFLEQPMRALGGPGRTGNFPGLEIAPIGHDGLIKRLFIAVLGVLNAKVMARRAQFADLVDGNLVPASDHN